MGRTVCYDSKGNEIYDEIKNEVRVRGFEVCKGYEAQLPQRNDVGSAGYDFHIISNVDTFIHPQETVKFNTGIRAYMQEDEVLSMHIRSSLGIKKNLVLSNGTGIIDSSYYDNPDNGGEIWF